MYENKVVTGFNAQQYFDANPDLAAAGLTVADARRHFDQFGYNELMAQPGTSRATGVTFGSAPVPLPQQVANTINNPVAPQNTEVLPQFMEAQQNEFINTVQAPTQAPQAQAPAPVTAQQAQTTQATATTASETDPLATIDPTQAQYTAQTVGAAGTEQAVAQQGVVDPRATVAGQLEGLYAELEFGEIPGWARGAVNAAEEIMAARGMGASSIGASAITQAVQQSAINIAAQDAATYFQMDLTNLNNRQQTELFNVQQRQQSLLSDQAAVNAARQFNAASATQLQTFQAGLISQIQAQNADRLNNMSQFNAAAQNQMESLNVGNTLQADLANSQIEAAVEQFNANLQGQREQFNTEMQFAIEQSNVNWRRNINTANTATANAANQVNAQNLFNMSQVAMNNMWQAWRDEASWLFQASESQKDRDYNLAQTAQSRQFWGDNRDDDRDFQMWSNIGGFVMNRIWPS